MEEEFELLTWPVSEDLIGREVVCTEKNPELSFWGFTKGATYTIGRDRINDIGPIDDQEDALDLEIDGISFRLPPLSEESDDGEDEGFTPAKVPLSIIPKGYKLVRIGTVLAGDLFVVSGGVVLSGEDCDFPAVIVEEIKPKTKTMYNIYTGEPIEVPEGTELVLQEASSRRALGSTVDMSVKLKVHCTEGFGGGVLSLFRKT